jgi:hypothetical protein
MEFVFQNIQVKQKVAFQKTRTKQKEIWVSIKLNKMKGVLKNIN